MKKFLAVVKREYMQRVRAKMFIVSTILLPLVMSLFGIVPAVIIGYDAGSRLRVAVVDRTGKMYEHLDQAVDIKKQQTTDNQSRISAPKGFGNFVFEPVSSDQSDEQITADLERRLRAKEIDGYLILPPDFIEHGQAEFFNRNPGDLMSSNTLQSILDRALREQRMAT